MPLNIDAATPPPNGAHRPEPYAGRERERVVMLAIFSLAWIGTVLASTLI
jgi:hypothetical protein